MQKVSIEVNDASRAPYRTGLETVGALVATLFRNKRTVFQMAPRVRTRSEVTIVEKKGKELICTYNNSE